MAVEKGSQRKATTKRGPPNIKKIDVEGRALSRPNMFFNSHFTARCLRMQL